jgi:hypothetical protein
MKILIAYDGSSCADSALEDLRHAGLPPLAETVVLSVSELWMPVLESVGAGEARIVGALRILRAEQAIELRRPDRPRPGVVTPIRLEAYKLIADRRHETDFSIEV